MKFVLYSALIIGGLALHGAACGMQSKLATQAASAAGKTFKQLFPAAKKWAGPAVVVIPSALALAASAATHSQQPYNPNKPVLHTKYGPITYKD